MTAQVLSITESSSPFLPLLCVSSLPLGRWLHAGIEPFSFCRDAISSLARWYTPTLVPTHSMQVHVSAKCNYAAAALRSLLDRASTRVRRRVSECKNESFHVSHEV